MRAVIVEPGKPARRHEMPNTYEALNAVLGGLIEPVRLGSIKPGRGITAWVNEEGMCIGLPWNRMLPTGAPLAGTIVITAEVPDDEKGFKNVDLTDLEEKVVIHTFNVECKMLDGSPASFESFEEMTGEPPIQVIPFDADDLNDAARDNRKIHDKEN